MSLRIVGRVSLHAAPVFVRIVGRIFIRRLCVSSRGTQWRSHAAENRAGGVWFFDNKKLKIAFKKE